MTAKDLKRLNRSDLMEMLLELSRENEELRGQVQELQLQLKNRSIQVDEAGSLAEAALRLNRIFEDAQAACEQYEQNVRLRCDRMEAETQRRCAFMLYRAGADPTDSEA